MNYKDLHIFTCVSGVEGACVLLQRRYTAVRLRRVASLGARCSCDWRSVARLLAVPVATLTLTDERDARARTSCVRTLRMFSPPPSPHYTHYTTVESRYEQTQQPRQRFDDSCQSNFKTKAKNVKAKHVELAERSGCVV